MNILYLIASPSPGGIESFVKDLAVRITEGGGTVHIGFLETATEACTSVEFEEKYLEFLKSAGISYFFIGRRARRWFWIGMAKVRRYVRDNSIDIYHAHLTYGIVFGALANVPRIYTHHSIEMRVGRLVFLVMTQLVDRLIGISDKCANELERHARREVATIFNGVNVKRFCRRGAGPRQLRQTVACISIGRICKEKNFGLLVRAIGELPASVRLRLTVRIVGAGSADAIGQLEKTILEEGVDDLVQLLGARSDIEDLLGSADMFLMSSASEGLPIALIEAAAAGLPCIVTDVGGCAEVIKTCGNGMVVSRDDPQALASAIEEMVGDSEQFANYSSNALSRSSAFSIERAALSHVSIYRDLLKSTRTKQSNAHM